MRDLSHADAKSAAPLRRPRLIIEPTRGWARLNLRELWLYRDLLWLLALRDVQLRYKQTVLGIAWVILQPLVAAGIFAVIFGAFAKLPSDGTPYLLFVFCGLLPWNLFAGAVQRAGNSLVGNANLISKVYFPRLIIPLASVFAVLIDLGVALGVMALLMIVYQVPVTAQILALPFFLALALIAALGISLWLTGLNVYYRDFMYALPFLMQVWLYASPVAYAAALVPEQWRALYNLNPLVACIEGFRWALLGRGAVTFETVALASVSAFGFFISGVLVFRRIERGFADVL